MMGIRGQGRHLIGHVDRLVDAASLTAYIFKSTSTFNYLKAIVKFQK
ncbi:MAG: hypothetical protein L6M37_06900 [Candidatus Methylarchaceae archaeon HK02M1]|nr:hypothetical protein [Candidatus Methylarchaceae archaeon HK01M]MCP8312657.1 hypothetical protein [Candidatus Methylarchaceae archaeon HK02M1]